MVSKGLKKLFCKKTEDFRVEILRIIRSKDAAALAKALDGITKLDLGYRINSSEIAKVIAAALLTNHTITYLHLGWHRKSNHNAAVGIGDEGAKSIAAALHINDTITNISFNYAYIGGEGAKSIATALQTNDTVTRIDLDYNLVSFSDGQIKEIEELVAANRKKRIVNYKPFIETQNTPKLATAMDNATHLRLYNTNIGVEDVKKIAAALSKNKSITSLRLQKCNINNECAKELADLLVKNDTIVKLILAENNIGDDGAKEIAIALRTNKTLTILVLAVNHIGDDGAKEISAALRTNKALTVLSLADNHIGDDGAKEIATALRTNKSVTNLDLTQNYIGDSGVSALADCISFNNILTDILLNGNKADDDLFSSIFAARSDPQMWAISYEMLLEVRDRAMELFKEDFDDKSMRDINEKIIVPVCQQNKKSYALSKNMCGLKTDVFVSHSWDEPFGEFTNCIEQAYSTKLRKPNLWICAFGLLQGNFEEIKDQLGTGETALRDSPFVRALKGAPNYLVVRNSRTDLCERIWCICEFVYAKKFKLIPGKTLVTGPDTFSNRNTSCVEAKSFDPSDKEKILKELTNNSSITDIDAYIKEFRSFGSSENIESEETSETPALNSEKMSITERFYQFNTKFRDEIANNASTDAQRETMRKNLTEMEALKVDVENELKEKVDVAKEKEREYELEIERLQKLNANIQVELNNANADLKKLRQN